MGTTHQSPTPSLHHTQNHSMVLGVVNGVEQGRYSQGEQSVGVSNCTQDRRKGAKKT